MYFKSIPANIVNNPDLREPQIDGYLAAHKHFISDKSTSHAIIVLPTGVGKSGLMGILPYGIATNRVLIITPQVTIREGIVNALNPIDPKNFWQKYNIISNARNLPKVIEYDGTTNKAILEHANIVVTNIHRLQDRFDSSLTQMLPSDFFDMILIDEGHHSAAFTWTNLTDYFADAKVVKVTATPYRTDGLKISGDLIYAYELHQAMHNKFIKSLMNHSYKPEGLLLSIDDNFDVTYTVKEIEDMHIKDKDWIARSVAYSKDCIEKIVDRSIRRLNEKKENSTVPHKIIAAAVSIKHAALIEECYEQHGMRTATIYSILPKEQKEKIFADLENHRIDVIIHINMLGEGFDHKYLSVAAIFRPFKSPLAYQQFVGRILRIIPEDEITNQSENIGVIVSHGNLYLDNLWGYYKKELSEAEILDSIGSIDPKLLDDSTGKGNGESRSATFGEVIEIGDGTDNVDAYMDTALIEQAEAENRAFEEKVKALRETLGIDDEQARRFVSQADTEKENPLLRPDLYYTEKKKDIDKKIRYENVPELIKVHELDPKGSELASMPIFQESPYRFVLNRIDGNAAKLAAFLNSYLKKKIGRSRKEWDLKDYDRAYNHLDSMLEHIDKLISIHLREDE